MKYNQWSFLVVHRLKEQTVLYSELAYDAADLSRGVM